MPETKLVFLINSMEGGGAERAMANLLTHLQGDLSGCDVHLVLLDDRRVDQTIPDYVTLHVLDADGSMARSLVAFFRLMARLRPDTCVSYLARANCLNVWGSKLYRYRAIISERVMTTSHLATAPNRAFLSLLTRLAYPYADSVIPVSQGVAEDLEENFAVSRHKMTVIGNPIDAAQIKSMAAAEPGIELPKRFIVAAGRLVVNKNFPLLLEAFAAANPEQELVILGEGPEREILQEKVARLNLDGRVHMPGFIRNPYPVLARAELYVAASNAEGFPNTLIEAMCLGLPAIATDCPSGPFEVLEGLAQSKLGPSGSARSGVLVPMNDVAAMTSALRFMQSAAVRADYARRASSRAGNYTVTHVVNAYLDLIGRRVGPMPVPAA